MRANTRVNAKIPPQKNYFQNTIHESYFFCCLFSSFLKFGLRHSVSEVIFWSRGFLYRGKKSGYVVKKNLKNKIIHWHYIMLRSSYQNINIMYACLHYCKEVVHVDTLIGMLDLFYSMSDNVRAWNRHTPSLIQFRVEGWFQKWKTQV